MKFLDLPVSDILPELDQALAASGKAVLVAPPGAGKTTLVPLHLLKATWRKDGLIIILEPRRLAARAAAKRMAEILNEKVGETVGYRMRMDQAESQKTRILVVTEGVFARMIVDDPELTNIAAVIFDEYHERSLDADFALALCLDVQAALRPDLRLLVMSATLDGARVAQLLDNAPVIESRGRSFPVDISYRPRPTDQRMEDAMASAIHAALLQEEGSILAFLPGQGEIERVKRLIADKMPPSVILAPLYGAMELRDQDIAIKPAQQGKRKVVLATSIAESSLTIDGVRIVIDSGLSRVPIYEPSTGLTRLETVRASRASIDQRAGRAGRTQAGLAIRLWHEGQTAALPPFSEPEILQADLSGLMLDCAAFGLHDPQSLRFLDTPPKVALNEAKELLLKLHAITPDGRLTPTGAEMRHYALPVRLAYMMIKAKEKNQTKTAAELAILLSERGLGGNDIDLDQRLSHFRKDRSDRAQKARHLAQKITGNQKEHAQATAGEILIYAFPDRIAKSRGANGQFLLANGRGAKIDILSSLATEAFLVVADLSGKASEARILSAARIDETYLLQDLQSDITTQTLIEFDKTNRCLKAREQTSLGAITLQSRTLTTPKGDDANQALLHAIQQYGLDLLPWNKETKNLRHRLQWLYVGLGAPWPDMSEKTLLDTLEDWLLPFMKGSSKLDDFHPQDLANALQSRVPYDLQNQISREAPTHFIVPTGSHIPIRYDGEAPVLSVRVQELFSLATHPTIAGGKIPLVLELLSPAHRPIQITRDLCAFWNGSWKDVRTDMRGRYPKHVWPEDPLQADPTRHAKSRGS